MPSKVAPADPPGGPASGRSVPPLFTGSLIRSRPLSTVNETEHDSHFVPKAYPPYRRFVLNPFPLANLVTEPFPRLAISCQIVPAGATIHRGPGPTQNRTLKNASRKATADS